LSIDELTTWLLDKCHPDVHAHLNQRLNVTNSTSQLYSLMHGQWGSNCIDMHSFGTAAQMFYCKIVMGGWWCNQRFEDNSSLQQLVNHDTQAANKLLCLDAEKGANILTQVWANRQPKGAVAMVNSDSGIRAAICGALGRS
jgi:hypothetical protein